MTKMKPNNPKCDHNGSGFSDADDFMEIHFDGDVTEGGEIHFFMQCDDCGQKMRVKCKIESIQEEK